MNYIKSKDDTKISYVKRGHGLPLILVGGALQTKEDHLFRRLIPVLAEEYSVVSYDRRGRGESEEGRLESAEEEIEDLLALVDSLKGPVFLFGNSSGAHLALKTAAINSKISKVAVYEAPFISDGQMGSAAEYQELLRQSIANSRPDRTLKLFLSRIGVPRFVIFVMQFLPMWKGLKALSPTLLNDAILVGDGDVPQNFELISAKVLALSGSSHKMQEAAKKLTEKISGSQFKILAGQKHDVDPKVLADELRIFFRG